MPEDQKQLTRKRLQELLDERDGEAQAYLSLLVPILQRMGGETVITTADAMAVPDGVTLWTEQAGADGIRVWIGAPRKDVG